MKQGSYEVTDSGDIEFIVNKADYDELKRELQQLRTQNEKTNSDYNKLKDKQQAQLKEYQKLVQDFQNFRIEYLYLGMLCEKQLTECANNPFEQLQQYKKREEDFNEQKRLIQYLTQREQQQNQLVADLQLQLQEQKVSVNDLTQKLQSQVLDLNQQLLVSEQKNQSLEAQLIELDNKNQETESQKNQILSSHYTRKEENLQLKIQTDNANKIIGKLEKEKRDLIEQNEEKSKQIAQLERQKIDFIAKQEQEKYGILSSLRNLQTEYDRILAENERTSVENINQASKIQEYLIQIHKKDEENQVFKDQIIRLNNEKEKASLNELLVQIYQNLLREMQGYEQLPENQRIESRESAVKTWNLLFNEYLRKPLEPKFVTFKHEIRNNWTR